MAYDSYKLIRVTREGALVTATVNAPPINIITMALFGELARLAAGGRIVRRKKRLRGGIKRRSVRIEGPAYMAGAVDTRRIGGRLVVARAVHEVNLAEALGYLLKGADRKTAENLKLVRLEPGGRVTGKRCGWSENVGAKARHLDSCSRQSNFGVGG